MFLTTLFRLVVQATDGHEAADDTAKERYPLLTPVDGCKSSSRCLKGGLVVWRVTPYKCSNTPLEGQAIKSTPGGHFGAYISDGGPVRIVGGAKVIAKQVSLYNGIGYRMSVKNSEYRAWSDTRKMLTRVAKNIRDTHKDRTQLTFKACGRIWNEDSVPKCTSILLKLLGQLYPEASKNECIQKLGELQANSRSVKFTDADVYDFNVYAIMYEGEAESSDGPSSADEESKAKEENKRKANAERNKRRRKQKSPSKQQGVPAEEDGLSLTEEQIPALRGITRLREIWGGADLPRGMFPARGVLDREYAKLHIFEKLVGLYAVSLHNVDVREQLDSLSSYGGKRQAILKVLAGNPLFEFDGFVLQDHTQGRVYILADGLARVKESFADPIFRLKGHKGPQMKVDGSRSKKFPDILAASMEGTGRPLRFVWTTDLKEN